MPPANTDNAQSQLEYETLPGPRSIRVLVLEKEEHEDDIRCSLQLAELDDGPEYDALSYVWGEPSTTTTITCNGHSIEVRANLGAALRRLRSRLADCVLWVDALCINQGDLDERNAQVLIMADIYRSAKQVKVYLGEQQPWSAAALRLLQVLSGIALSTDLPENQVMAMLQTAYWRGDHQFIPAGDSPDWDAFQDFFRQEYFSRMWVIQETALATDEPEFIYGDMTITWKAISSVARMWHISGLRSARPTKDLSFIVPLIEEYRTLTPALRKEHFTLAQFLRHTRRCQSTDPRDRIYALFGIASDVYDRKGKALLEPDYRATVEEVYRKVAAELIRRDGNLDLLAFCRHRGESEELYLPSWVPDWTVSHVDELPDIIYGNGLLGKYTGLEASSYFEGRGSISADARVLEVSGLEIDEIQWVSERMKCQHFDVLPEFREKPGNLKRLWDKVVSSLTTPDDDDDAIEAVKHAFWRTLISNMGVEREKAGPEYYIHFLSYWRVSRTTDWQTENYLKTHPETTNRPTFEDREAVREAWKRNQQLGHSNPDQMAAVKRACSKYLREHGVLCKAGTVPNPEFDHSNPEEVCQHCTLVNDPKFLKMVFPLAIPLKFDDPTYEMIDDDPFIAEWFARLRSDEEHPISVIESEANRYANCLARCARERAFFLTAQGRMGIGPSECKAGDRVAVLGGAGVPFVVRKRNFLEYNLDSRNRDGKVMFVNDVSLLLNTFTLVGESYVHGVMDGSAVPVDDKGRPQWDTLHLV
jgi:hypothetical protein